MIPIIVFSLLFVLLIVFCVLSAKYWHWSNIVFLILCYIAGVAACVGASDVLDKRNKALALVKKTRMEAVGLEIDTDNDGIDDAIDADVDGNGADNDNDGISDSKANLALANQVDYLIYGSPNSLSYSPNSLRGLSARYELEFYGRGRVWESGAVTADGPNRVFQLTVPRPDDALTLIGSELYAFRDFASRKERARSEVSRGPVGNVGAPKSDDTEMEITKKEEVPKLPIRFIGSMRVIAEDF